MNNITDFEIINGVLIKYKGTDPNVIIPEGVTEIGGNAFSWCESLTSVTIPNGVTKIGNGAFEWCSSLESVTIPNSVTTIGEKWIFFRCVSLTSITVDPSNPSYKSIDGNLYSRDGKTLIQYAIGKKDKNFVIPEGVITIGDCAFCECKSLKDVTISDGVTEIGNSAFEGCASLASITIPNSVTTIEKYAFCCCESLGNLTVDSSNPSYKSIDGNLYSKDGKTLIQYAIGKSEKGFAIPNSVTSIGGSAFYGCSSLISVTIPNSVTSIERGAFYWCPSLTINCEASENPDGWSEDWNPSKRPVNWGYKPVEPSLDFEITNGVLVKYKGTDPNVIIPNGVTEIGASAFYGCRSLKNITIPNGVTTIGEYAFAGCSSLENITISNSITTIQYCAFLNCTSLASVEIPNRVTAIGHSAFYGCSSLKSITIPNSVTSIGAEAFSGCSSLTSIIIHKGVTKIEHYAFSFCPSLTINCEASEKPSGWSKDWNPSKRPVNWGYNPAKQEKKYKEEKKHKEVGNVKPSPIENFKITSNGALTKYLGAEETITIPEGVKSISTFVFTENYRAQNTVKHIILPKSLEVIEDGAFADLAVLEQIVIPKGVKAIGRVAFRGCESLTIYCEVNEPPKGWDTRKYSLWSAERPVVWGYKSKK